MRIFFVFFILQVVAFILLVLWSAAGYSEPLSRSTMQHDAPTTRFYTSDGKSAGSATTYGNVTKFYGADGRLVGSATHK
jgi:hypothetical protein